MTTYSMPDPEDLEEMFEHMDDPHELNFDNDDYVEINENDWSEPYDDLDNLLDDAEALASAVAAARSPGLAEPSREPSNQYAGRCAIESCQALVSDPAGCLKQSAFSTKPNAR